MKFGRGGTGLEKGEMLHEQRIFEERREKFLFKNQGKAIVYIMTKDYMQNFNPPGRSYLTGILKGCRQNQIPTEPILKAARKPPVPGQTQKSQPKKRKAGQER